MVEGVTRNDMKLSECVIKQYRGGKLVRSFVPTGNKDLPWRMSVNGKTYLRTHGWVMSKVLPTLVDGSLVTTKVESTGRSCSTGGSDGGV